MIEVGCMGSCYAEPMVEIALPGGPSVLYGEVNPAVARKLVRCHVGQGTPYVGLALATDA